MRIVQVRLDLDAQCQQIAQPLFSFSFVNFAENANFLLEKNKFGLNFESVKIEQYSSFSTIEIKRIQMSNKE